MSKRITPEMIQELIAKRKQEWEDLLAKNLPEEDEDGYPTEYALEKIEKWPYTDQEGWFKYINFLWALQGWGWHEDQSAEDINKTILNISTAGWSGNESIIRAMEKNHMLWGFCWVSSRRGGHYVFERKLNDD